MSKNKRREISEVEATIHLNQNPKIEKQPKTKEKNQKKIKVIYFKFDAVINYTLISEVTSLIYELTLDDNFVNIKHKTLNFICAVPLSNIRSIAYE